VIELTVGHVRELAEMRRLLAEFAVPAGALAHDVVLAANELATNSLLYAGGACRVLGSYPNDQAVRIEVTDRGGRAFALPTRFAPVLSTGGRRLMIVRSVASRCGMRAVERSTHVWFEVDLPCSVSAEISAAYPSGWAAG
jgi:anti-sigma regulatory factor (Ser/Thr protein kinase)